MKIHKYTKKISLILVTVLSIVFFIFLVFSKDLKAATMLHTLRPSSNNLGLIGFWTFNGADVVNGRVMDRGSSLTHGAPSDIASSTFYTIGKIGQGIRFDGVNDCVNMGDVSAYDFGATDSFTVSVWYKNSNNATTLFVTKKSQSGNTVAGFYYGITTSQGGDLDLRISDGVNQVAHSPSNITGLNNGEWRNIVTVVNRTNQTITSYVDGRLDGSSDISAVGSLSTNSFFAFGGRAASAVCSTPSQFFLDDVRIYNRALSAAEIARFYNMGAGKQNASQNKKYTNGLVGLWSFDGPSVVNGQIMDLSGNANNGTPRRIATSTFYVSGKIGQGVDFDGATYSVTVPHSTTLTTDLHNGFTVSVWIKPDGYGNISLGRIVDKSDSTVALNGFAFYLRNNSAPLASLVFNINNTADFINSSANTVPLKQWTHGVVVVDSVGNAEMYINGNLAATKVLNAPSGITTTNPLYIGSYSDGSSREFDGAIDDLRIYKKVLSPAEISGLYNLGGGKQNASLNKRATGGLVAAFSFDGPNIINGKIKDITGNGYDAPPTSISTTTFYTIGKMGQGVKTDGVNDCVISSALPITNFPFTLSAWAKVNSGTGVILGISDSTVASQRVWNVEVGSVGAMEFREDTGATNYTLNGTSKTNDGRWHHIVGVFAGTTDKKLYVDGVLENSSSFSKEWQPGANRFSVGCRADSGPDSYFDGWIDDARIYNTALSESEIVKLYNLGK